MGATRDCLAELQYLSAESTSDRRDDILRCVTDLFLITADRHRPSDTDAFGDVMGRLADNVDFAGRAELAQRLADAPRAPRDLICKLARDEIGIARPLLERSTVLADADLIEMAQNRNPVRIAAMAQRRFLSTDLTDTLAQSGDAAVLAQMAGNPNAAFSVATLGRMAARANVDPKLRRALLRRDDVPPVLVERLETHEAAAGAPKPPNGHRTVDQEPDSASASTPDDDATEVSAVMDSEAETQLAELARAGRIEEAIAALSELTGLDPPLVRNCVIAAEMPALVVLCKAHRLSSPTLSALLQLRLSAGAASSKSIASAMRRYETMETHMAQRIMRFLKVRLANTGGS